MFLKIHITNDTKSPHASILEARIMKNFNPYLILSKSNLFWFNQDLKKMVVLMKFLKIDNVCLGKFFNSKKDLIFRSFFVKIAL